jgi:hypothetical protein
MLEPSDRSSTLLIVETYEQGPHGGGVVRRHFAVAPAAGPLPAIALDLERRQLASLADVLAEAKATGAKMIWHRAART